MSSFAETLVDRLPPEALAELLAAVQRRLARDPSPALVAAMDGVLLSPNGSEPLADVERRHILSVLSGTWGNRRQAAEALAIGERTLHRKLALYAAAGHEIPGGWKGPTADPDEAL